MKEIMCFQVMALLSNKKVTNQKTNEIDCDELAKEDRGVKRTTRVSITIQEEVDDEK